MFTKKVTDDDNFMALSSSAQALYLHLSMSADDDGFCNQVSLSMFKAHASIQDLQALLEKRYIYQFENGVIVIKHWRMANALRKDRYTPTAFQEELSKLRIKDNGSYSWLPDGCQMVANWLPQDSIGKDSIDKDNNNILSDDNISSGVTAEQGQNKTNYQWLISAWNSLSALGIAPIKRISNKRADSVRARLREYSQEDVLEAIENIKHSEFLLGRHGGREWQITFDWFIRPNNFPKVLEGNYNNSGSKANETALNEFGW